MKNLGRLFVELGHYIPKPIILITPSEPSQDTPFRNLSFLGTELVASATPTDMILNQEDSTSRHKNDCVRFLLLFLKLKLNKSYVNYKKSESRPD